jgi:hypothetical protein
MLCQSLSVQNNLGWLIDWLSAVLVQGADRGESGLKKRWDPILNFAEILGLLLELYKQNK